MGIDAVVLAGDRSAARLLYGTNKAFLRLRGKPLLSYVISALDQADKIRSIHIVGPGERLRELLSEFKYQKPVSYVEQSDTILNNLWYGSLHTFPSYKRGSDYRLLKDSPEAEKCILAVTCDIPLLEPLEVDHFIKNAPVTDFDMIFGVTRKELLLPFAPHGSEPGIDFAYFVFREVIFRHANFFLMRPLKLGYVMDEFIPLIYSIRYQKDLYNQVKGILAIIRAGAGLKGLYYFLTLHATRAQDMKGRRRLRNILRRGVALPNVLKYAAKVLQTRFGAFETIGPGPAIDTDNETDLTIADQMFDRWKQIQAQMLQGKYPLPQDV